MKQSGMWKFGFSLLLAVVSVIVFKGAAYAAGSGFSLSSDVQFIVPFNPGGGGAVGDAYTFSQRGNPATIKK